MKKINFEAGTQISPAKVNEDNTITPAVYEGNTPLSPFVLNTLQDNIEKEFQVDKTTISGKTSQEGTPSSTNIVPIKNVNVYGVNKFDVKNSADIQLGKGASLPGTEGNKYTLTTSEYNAFLIVKVNPNKNVVISSNSTQYKGQFYVACLKDKETEAGKVTSNWITSSGLIQTTANTQYLGIVARTQGNAAKLTQEVLEELKIKVEENSTKTQYTPYNYGFLDLNLQKDTDTKTVTLISKRLHEGDSVDENGFNYNRKTLILDGSQAIAYSTVLNDYFTAQYTLSNIKINGSLISNKLPYVSDGWNTNSENIGFAGTNKIQIKIDTSKLSSSDATGLNEYLKNNPITVEYELATQENKQFNETNQMAWNTLEDLLLQGYTLINSSSDELQPTITLTEHTANEIYIENREKFKKLEEINNYSTEEIVIGKWINGKPLYRKVYEVSTPSALTFTKVITLDSTTKVTKCDIRVDATNGASFIVPYYSASDDFISSYIYDGVYLKVSKSNYQSLPCYITLEYTKTTD